ncbi:peptidase M19 [Cystobacter fuscus]|uniref:Peptidase M19 n=1 Tax=Cystobacter fuscus TaxID=43 RepID=A0A250JGS1_9BACT|nr:peptidase M19 [Cystobacter fuscus]
MFAEEAFGGGWFHGGHTGALTRCDGGWPESDHLNLCPDSGSVDLRGVPVLSQLFGVAGAVGHHRPPAGLSREDGADRGTRRATGLCHLPCHPRAS